MRIPSFAFAQPEPSNQQPNRSPLAAATGAGIARLVIVASNMPGVACAWVGFLASIGTSTMRALSIGLVVGGIDNKDADIVYIDTTCLHLRTRDYRSWTT